MFGKPKTMRVKVLEVRDRMTFIPVVAMDMSLTGKKPVDYLLRSAGYSHDRCILMTTAKGGYQSEHSPFSWNNRTFHVAHLYIMSHWDQLRDGDVIDVEFIMRETSEPKKSMREKL